MYEFEHDDQSHWRTLSQEPELGDLPREQPYREELDILHLPTEILRIIIKKCSTNVISRQCINMTCSKFLDIMTSLPQNYRLYIKPCSEMALGLKNVMSYRLSIQELIRTVGRGSGIIMSVQGMIAHTHCGTVHG